MGDGADMSDVGRFIRSKEGREILQKLADELVGRQIKALHHFNATHRVEVVATLDNGEVIALVDGTIDVDDLREDYADMLNREFLVDYPEKGRRHVL